MTAEAHTYTTDDTLPSLYIPAPECSHCLNEVQIEDGYAYCQTCLIQWDQISEDAVAEPDPNEEGTEVPCAIVLNEQHYRPEYDHGGKHWSLGPNQPCILPSGHDGAHLNPHTVTTTPLEATS